jgi:DNA-binding NarL/FixJ family response regulator
VPTIRTLIADDTALLRRLLASQLARESDIEIIGEAEDGRQAVELTHKLRPDVVVMDLEMPHLNGTQATERILAQMPHVRVVLLTGDESLAPLGRLAGATECLIKNCTPQELAEAIRRSHASRGAASPDRGGGTDRRIALDLIATRSGLTERERSVVEKMVDTERTIQQIARNLSDEAGVPVTESAVKHALERAMVKLRIEPRTRAALVKYVLEFSQTNPSSG